MARRGAVNNDSDPIIVSSEDIESVKVKIAGEIATSKSPGITMKKWRQLFGEKQRDVAARMGVAPSVLSDYEQGKRSPGIKFVKRYVESLITLDLEKGGANIRHYSDYPRSRHKAILDMREFSIPITINKLTEAINGPASPEKVDKLAVELAEFSGIPLILSMSKSVKDLIEALRGLE